MKGYAGNILILNLTDESYEIIDSTPYVEEWYGGHGLASKLFWDYCEDKTVEPFDPKNVTVIAGGPFSGSLVPAAAARVEMTGLGPFSYPEWYTRSSIGGRIAGMMKASGFDATVVCGKASHPVWISVVNGTVVFNDAAHLWGLGTWDTQEKIWAEVTHNTPDGEWYEFTQSRDGGRSTERPAVLAIGPAGENLARVATVTHDAGHVAGQSGFGAVWGAKNLKAISFLGSKSFEIADPAALIDMRIKVQDKLVYKIDDPTVEPPNAALAAYGEITRNPGFSTFPWNLIETTGRPVGCEGCYRNCRVNVRGRIGNETTCNAASYYTASGKTEDKMKTNTLLNDLGIDGFEVDLIPYLRNLNKMGVMGPGCEIDTDLPFDRFNEFVFADTLLHRIAYREEIGDDLAEGLARAAMKWGRWDEDTKTGLLDRPYWGYSMHYDPRVEVEWGMASILGERDVNEHGLNWILHWTPHLWLGMGFKPFVSAEGFVTQVAKCMGVDDPECLDFSETGMYSDKMLKTIEWYRYYGRFWTQSMALCDWAWPSLINLVNFSPDDYAGVSPDAELAFFKAVTGKEITYEESLDMGRKFLMLDRAIWIEQGRTREVEQFADYIYNVPVKKYMMPAIENGKWEYSWNANRVLDRDKFEELKGRLYEHDGLDQKGYPKRSELEKYGLNDVAKRLTELGKIGE